MPSNIRLRIVPASDAHSSELDGEAVSLGSQIRSLDVVSVSRDRKVEAEGAKGADGPGVASLIVAAIPTAQLLHAITTIVKARLAAGVARSVKLTIDDDTIEVTALSEAVQTEMVRQWIERHAKDSGNE